MPSLPDSRTGPVPRTAMNTACGLLAGINPERTDAEVIIIVFLGREAWRYVHWEVIESHQLRVSDS